MFFAMQKIHRHFFIWHFFPIIGWMEHQELGIPLGYVIETNPMKKPTDHFWSYLTLSPQIWRCGSKWQLLYIYIYIYMRGDWGSPMPSAVFECQHVKKQLAPR
jgi:hypothetical protein